jgi:nucleoside-diphosphate-sugar epimerase
MKILITGVVGLIGYHLVKTLNKGIEEFINCYKVYYKV